MKAVSAAYKSAARSARPIILQEVYYKRRYWVESSRTYTWEADWTRIQESEVESITPITGKLDTEKLNEFKVSNLTIILKNIKNAWTPGNPSGKFKGDTASPRGYEPYWTKFQVKLGYVLADDTEEVVACFTGLATELTPDPKTLTIAIRVDGLEALLMNADAENVSTKITNEVLTGTVNGINREFTTAQPGVGIFDDVSIDGITEKGGVDYTLSDLNDKTLPGKVTFSTAPTVGQVPRATYRYWKQSRKVEDLVKDLLTEAGIPTVNQIVDQVLFPSTINNTWSQTTQADFSAGTNTDLDLAGEPNALKIDFNDVDQKVLLDDMSDISDWTTLIGTASVVSGKMRLDDASVRRLSSKVTGVWQMEYQFSGLGSVTRFGFHFMASNIYYSPFSTRVPNGYTVAVTEESFPGAGNNLQLWRWNAAGDTLTVIGQASGGLDTSAHTLRVSRAPGGRIRVYLDNVLKIDVVDNTWTTTSYIGLEFSTVSSPATCDVDNLYVPKDTLTAEHISQVLDMLTTPVALGRLLRVHDTDGGTITYYTRTGTANPPGDAYVQVSDNTQINSELKRYGQVKVSLSCSSSSNADPTVYEYHFEYKNSAVLVSLANFTGKTCYQAISDLGKFCNYEWGFTAGEDFFFRSKIVTVDVDEALDYRTNILKDGIESLGAGYERVYSEVQARYGDFDVTVKSAMDSPDAAGARFAKRRLVVEGGDVVVNSDADIASGLASLYLNYYGKLRRRIKARCKIMPHVDLGDTVTVRYLDGLPDVPWHVGSIPDRHGDYALEHFGAGNMIADGQLFKVIGNRHDKKNGLSEFELEEILS